MASTATSLEWCIVRLGEDVNWWVDEISDEVHWDLDGLSIIDPRQLSHLLDLVDPLRDYDFQNELLEEAFFAFRIDRKLDDQRLRLVRTSERILDADEPLFVLPDIIDEDKSPYQDLLDHISRLRVHLLNDSIEFERKFTLEELEEELREDQNSEYMEGRAVHAFKELCDILEFVPAGFELDEEEAKETDEVEDAIDDDLPEVDEEEEKRLNEDEDLNWDEDEEEDDDFSEKPESEEDTESLDDLEDE